jgi:hypothetical protein
MNDELENMWKKIILNLFKILRHVLFAQTQESREIYQFRKDGVSVEIRRRDFQ